MKNQTEVMLYQNEMKIHSENPEHETTKVLFNHSTDYQDKNISYTKLNDKQETLVKPLLETCLKFGSLILDLMDEYDIDDVINQNCSMSLVSEDLIEN